MKSTIFKRAAALLLALVMCLTAFPGFGITAHAATDVTDEIFMIAFPREGDSAYDDDWGHGALSFKNGWHTARSRYTNIRAIGSYSSQICYCIEPGVSQNTGDEFKQKGENFWDNYPSDYNDVLSPDEIKLFIGRIFQYGYTGNISLNWRSQNSADADKLSHAIATQLLIWETMVGERDADFNKVDPGSYDAVLGYLNEKHPLRDQVMSHYNSIVSSVKKHTKLPSFMSKSTGKAQTVELAWNGSEYTATLTDSNEVLSGYTFSSSNTSLKFTISGNKLTISSPTAPAEKVSITAEKTKSQRKGVVVWTDGVYGPEGELQDVVTFAETVSDPVKGYLNVTVSVGSLKIIKESEDGKVDGVRFRVVGNGIDETVTTGKGGQIQIDNLTPGTYEVSELSEDIYEPQESQTVTVAIGQTASVTFSNILKRGNLKVIKTAEDDFIEGIRFHLTGTSAAGIAVDEYAVTDATGAAVFENLPIGSGYKLEEVDTKAYYVVPDAQTSVIEWSTVTEYRFHNELKRGNLKVSKSAEDNFVEGIRFRLTGTSDCGIPVDEYAVTDASGVAVFENILIGSGYTLEEVDTATRYVIPDSQTIEIRWNEVTEASFENKLVRGSILCKKVDEFGNTISGALFGLYHEDVMDFSEENAAMTALSDDSGIFSFQEVPYGSWIVRELRPAPGFVLNENSYPVAVGEDESVIEIVIENRFIVGSVQTSKVDADYPNNKLSGAVFEIYVDANCDQVYTTEIDVLIGEMSETAPGIYRMDNLRYCGYFLYEKTAPDGFLKDDNYHYFEISQDGEVVTVENEAGVGFLNKPITGSVQTTKVDADYPDNKLSGAVFEVYADADGDQIYNAEVDTLIGEMAEAETGIYCMDKLRYGGYFLIEKSAPEGFLKDDNYHYFQIRQNGEVVTVENEAGVGFLNKPITGSVQTTKVDADYPDNKLTGAVFEVYSDKDGDQIYNTEVDTLIGEMAEAETGIYRMDNLRYGGYFLFEKTAPDGFLKDENYHYFEIRRDGEVVTVENEAGVGFLNKPVTGSVQTTKVDADYPDHKLTGAVFEIYRDTDNDGIFNAEVDVLHGEMTETGPGIYRMDNLRCGSYFLHEKTAPYGFLRDEGYHLFQINTHGEVVTVENEAGVGFINQPGKLYYRLGQMNLSGTGTPQDLAQAAFYFRKAADLKNTDALYGLGKLYLNKYYADYDPQKAVAFLIAAAKQDHEFAQYTLGKLFLKGEEVPKNVSYALRWLEEAAAKGNPYAEYLLGKTLLLGDDVERDSERGEALLRKAADSGNVYAAYTLGKELLEGNLLLQDIPEALRLISQAADGGFSSAQYLLGKLLHRGEVTAQDIPKALSYLENASVQDHPYAAYLAGKILLTEESVKAIPKAIRYFEIASDASNDFAEYQLGKLYLYGKEVPQDYEKALAYLSSSAAHGNQYAEQLLHSIQTNRNCSAALGTLRLFHQLSQMIQKRLEDEWKHKAGTIDRKLKRIIDEKKQAHGLKQG